MSAKNVAMVLGVILTILGIWGLVVGVTTNVLWFSHNLQHDVIHLVTGILGIWFARRGEMPSHAYAKVFGVIYALVAILGFVAGDTMMNMLNTNAADNWLHVVLALIFLWVGFFSCCRTHASGTMSGPSMGGGQSM